jgi:hypothetical protein
VPLVINARTDTFLLGLGGDVDERASRVSLGNAAMLATLGARRDIAREVRACGTWDSIERSFYGFSEAARLFRVRERSRHIIRP